MYMSDGPKAKGRGDYIVPADYSKDSKMETTLVAIIDQIETYHSIMKLHLCDMDAAHKTENQ